MASKVLLAATGPFLYGAVSLWELILWSAGPDHNEIVHPVGTALFALKLTLVPSLILLLVWCSRRIQSGRHRWIMAAGLWSTLAVVAVSTVAASHEWIASAANNPTFYRRWPTDISATQASNVPGYEIFIQWDTWSNPTAVIGRELAFLIATAFVTAAVIRFGPGGHGGVHLSGHRWQVSHQWSRWLSCRPSTR